MQKEEPVLHTALALIAAASAGRLSICNATIARPIATATRAAVFA
jgi:hypothetical protein